ncbi:hypothetical protein [Pectinatus frisingensis]|uniref:hypothetical protein n=1 Tax=Pectinatus frisingensis TaxID=865 RepID=UPI0018C6F724|nr:hypothetical protein [Pectinatus frisingensis]
MNVGLAFKRFFSRGSVLVENILLAMMHNINKLQHKIQADHQGRYIFILNMAAELKKKRKK